MINTDEKRRQMDRGTTINQSEIHEMLDIIDNFESTFMNIEEYVDKLAGDRSFKPDSIVEDLRTIIYYRLWPIPKKEES